jgi:hypothetical protein
MRRHALPGVLRSSASLTSSSLMLEVDDADFNVSLLATVERGQSPIKC